MGEEGIEPSSSTLEAEIITLYYTPFETIPCTGLNPNRLTQHSPNIRRRFNLPSGVEAPSF